MFFVALRIRLVLCVLAREARVLGCLVSGLGSSVRVEEWLVDLGEIERVAKASGGLL